MTAEPSDRYYIRRQTHAGDGQGKWRVHTPNGHFSIGPACDTRKQALWLAAVFTYARRHVGWDVALDYEGFTDRCYASPGETELFPRKDGKLL